MQFKRLLTIAVLVVIFCTPALAQEHVDGPVIRCFSTEGAHHKMQDGMTGRKSLSKTLSTLTFNAVCVDIPEEAINSVLRALTIWDQYIKSPVPINLEIQWTTFPNPGLASSRPSKLFRKLKNAAYSDDWHPVALAEKIEGRNLNESEADIVITINEAVNWYFGTDAMTPADEFDLVSVILHEICHGLGFLTSAKVADNIARFDEKGQLLLLDEFLYNTDHVFIRELPWPSERLYREFTGDELYCNHASAKVVKMYAPPAFDPVSSICHFDESEYPAGNENALMTPFFKSGEAIHTPGPALLEVLNMMGWREEKYSLLVFPNPSTGLVSIRHAPDVIITTVTIFDSRGSVVSEYDHCCNTQVHFPSCGIFTVVAHTNHGVMIERVVVN